MANTLRDIAFWEGLQGPAQDGFSITPADANLTQIIRGIYVGVTGNVVIMTPQGTILTFSAVPAGVILPVMALQVRAATSAASLIGLL